MQILEDPIVATEYLVEEMMVMQPYVNVQPIQTRQAPPIEIHDTEYVRVPVPVEVKVPVPYEVIKTEYVQVPVEVRVPEYIT